MNDHLRNYGRKSVTPSGSQEHLEEETENRYDKGTTNEP